MRQKAIVIVLIALISGLAIAWYQSVKPGPRTSSGTLTGTVWPDPRPLPEFQLSDHNGKAFGRDQLQGQWTLMFFGFTSCPDICPTTMTSLRSVTLEMEKSGNVAPDVVMVSVDPDRDDAMTLADYVTHFNPDFVGVRGASSELYVLSLHIGATYNLNSPDDDGNYDVAHSASLFLIDPQARLHAVFSPPHKPADVAQRLAVIRLQYEQSQADQITRESHSRRP